MEQLKVFEFLEQKKEFLFPNEKYSDSHIESALLAVPDSLADTVLNIPFRKPSTVQIIAVFPGSLGIDRFYLGDIKKGILKYFTFGGFGIWWIKDILSAKKRCRAYNCQKLMEAINNPALVAQMQQNEEKLNKAAYVAKAVAPAVKDLAKSVKDGASSVGKTFHPF